MNELAGIEKQPKHEEIEKFLQSMEDRMGKGAENTSGISIRQEFLSDSETVNFIKDGEVLFAVDFRANDIALKKFKGVLSDGYYTYDQMEGVIEQSIDFFYKFKK